MALETGTRIGIYEVTGKLGEGGMGEVYRAHDTTLDRDVALKVLSEAFTADPDRLARFQREAKVLASLNHPNIGVIHGLESAGETQALILELIEGPTLADRIAEGPIPVDDALAIAKQIAEALEAAHERGIIHRDLKPANVKVRPDGMVKVLDFGLAKAVAADTSEISGTENPTVSLTGATQMGMVVGTAAYMSPEQAKGKAVDKRADIWAFGVVLLEMVGGKRVFEGETASETMAAVMMKEPNWDVLPTDLSLTLDNLIRRCLEKDLRKRIRDIGDVQLAMEGAFETTTPVDTAIGTETTGPLPLWQRPVGIVVMTAVAAVITVVTMWTVTSQPARPVSRLVVSVPPSRTVVPSATYPDVVISGDGTHVVYQSGVGAPTQFDVRMIDQLESVVLRGPEQPFSPFISPDGTWVGFHAGGRSPLQKVSVLGGPPLTVTELPDDMRGASWTPDDTIVFGTVGGGLFRVAAAGGTPESLTVVQDSIHSWPDVLPGDAGVLFSVSVTTSSAQDDQIAVLDLETGEHTVIIQNGSYPRYSPTGHIVYAVGGTLRAVAFDVGTLTVTSDPVPVLEGVMTKASGAANFDLSDTGTLVYVSGSAGGGARRTFVWVDRDGNEEPLSLPARAYANPRVSPDGTRIAVTVQESEQDLWVFDAVSAAGLRLTQGYTVNTPVWTPDGSRIVFSSLENTYDLYVVPADGSGEVERLTESEASDYLTSITPDGTTLGFVRIFDGLAGAHREVWEVPLEGDRTPVPLLEGDFSRGNAEYSPDGNWLVYRSNQSGEMEVYVQPYPGPGAVVPVSIGGGDAVMWSLDGAELFYRLGNRVMAVGVNANDGFRTEQPTELFAGNYVATPGAVRQYHVAKDGRFLMMRDDVATGDSENITQVVLIQNWFEELKELVPIP